VQAIEIDQGGGVGAPIASPFAAALAQRGQGAQRLVDAVLGPIAPT
jgi:hypothetical protein